MHVARPTVVFVNNKYYMYLEAPAVGGEGSDNNVFLATSTDGKKFTLYPSNDNPQPVIRQPESTMNKGLYGVGQPSAFYKDGKFYVYYTDAVGSDGIRVATSTDGINFGKYEDHKRVFDRAGCGVKYNSKTGKFMMLYVVDPSNWNSSLARNETVFLQESSCLLYTSSLTAMSQLLRAKPMDWGLCSGTAISSPTARQAVSIWGARGVLRARCV